MEAYRPGDQQVRRVLENAAFFEVDRNRQPVPFGGGDALAVATGKQGEIAFVFPWAVIFRSLGIVGLVEMGIFLGLLVLGFVYVWKKGALEWE